MAPRDEEELTEAMVQEVLQLGNEHPLSAEEFRRLITKVYLRLHERYPETFPDAQFEIERAVRWHEEHV